MKIPRTTRTSNTAIKHQRQGWEQRQRQRKQDCLRQWEHMHRHSSSKIFSALPIGKRDTTTMSTLQFSLILKSWPRYATRCRPGFSHDHISTSCQHTSLRPRLFRRSWNILLFIEEAQRKNTCSDSHSLKHMFRKTNRQTSCRRTTCI